MDTYALYNADMSRTDYLGCGITRTGGGTAGDPYTYTVASSHVDRPVIRVSWGDAARFANWLHNGQPTGEQDLSTTEDGAYYLNGATNDAALLAVTREPDWKWAIPSEDEWYKAAYYDPTVGYYYEFPTNRFTEPGRDLDDLSGNNANYYGSPYPIQSPYYTTAAGEFQDSNSPHGTFDQGGNVREWNEAVLDGLFRGVRGGAFYDEIIGLHAAWGVGGIGPSDAALRDDNGVGFRVSTLIGPGDLDSDGDEHHVVATVPIRDYPACPAAGGSAGGE